MDSTESGAMPPQTLAVCLLCALPHWEMIVFAAACAVRPRARAAGLRPHLCRRLPRAARQASRPPVTPRLSALSPCRLEAAKPTQKHTLGCCSRDSLRRCPGPWALRPLRCGSGTKLYQASSYIGLSARPINYSINRVCGCRARGKGGGRRCRCVVVSIERRASMQLQSESRYDVCTSSSLRSTLRGK